MENERVVSCLASEYGFSARKCTLISKSQSAVFRAKSVDTEVIVRVTSSSHRTKNEVESELEYIDDVLRTGVLSPAPQVSLSGLRVVSLPHPCESELVVVFASARGREIQPTDLGAPLYRAIGQLCARLHSVGVGAKARRNRQPWFSSPYITSDLDEFLPKADALVASRLRQLVEFLKGQWGRSEAILIHADIHFRNLFLSSTGLEIIDFDNCEFGHECLDFAAILYDCAYSRVRADTRTNLTVDGATRFAMDLWAGVTAGYSSVRAFPEFTMEALEAAVRLREIIRYTDYHRRHDVKTMSADLRTGLAELRGRIEQGISPIRIQDLVSA